MSQNFDYLRTEFNFNANRTNPKGLDFQGIDAIAALSQKIDKRPLREYFCENGEMKAVPYQDWLFEVKATQRKYSESP